MPDWINSDDVVNALLGVSASCSLVAIASLQMDVLNNAYWWLREALGFPYRDLDEEARAEWRDLHGDE